ncbi:hypothetical protein J25TS5_04150 [Paenibacillus faecis]|uniref:hypothetical protein n=1 Tax=Paenibacillus faecis TaxID=862114 RepID=UPI001B0D4AA5|nr:hypothetical protein [Paenibacillus faecis]GIO83483.1 hypothetical protein J25TS5_04150 [Paenibacillus faecis]
MYKVNINDIVKVKLTEHGKKIEREKNEKLNELISAFGGQVSEYKPSVDEDGYTTYQLWSLFGTFGSHMGLTQELPFETEIIITKAKPMNTKIQTD